jgi:hypothetical protein
MIDRRRPNYSLHSQPSYKNFQQPRYTSKNILKPKGTRKAIAEEQAAAAKKFRGTTTSTPQMSLYEALWMQLLLPRDCIKLHFPR